MSKKSAGAQFAPIETLTCPNVGTAAAAFYLSRKQQTLRGWASNGGGPVTVRRINGRLAWPVAEIMALTLGVAQ
jgi:hypothetical protein